MYWAVRLAREVGVCLTCKSSLLETLANHTCAANAPELFGIQIKTYTQASKA